MSEGPVYNLLLSKGLAPTPSGQDFLIKCLNPDHEDSHPSMRIDKVSGIGHCFSCGFGTNIFKYFGIITTPTSVRVAKLKEKIQKLQAETSGLEMLPGAIPHTTKFRGISGNLFKELGVFTTSLVPEMEDRLIFPITDITGKIRVFLGRHLLSNANPRYVIFPKNASLPIFPAKLDERTNHIVLVEGMFDFLNMYDKGVRNTICVFGTNTLKADIKYKLLPFKAQGVTHIFILFDGDEPGRKAGKELTPLLEELGFIVETIHLEDDVDPGELTEEDVRAIKEYISGKSKIIS